MRALKLVGPGRLELQDVAVPEIGPSEVLVKVAAAGLCHSDLHILEMDETWPFFGNTIGHEVAGHVEKVGEAVTGFTPGEAVLASVIWFCGHCRNCLEGRTNSCTVNGSRTQFPHTPGIGPDGGMAEYIAVHAVNLDKIGDLDPIGAAPLSDAATTPMRAINSAREQLTADSTVAMIGMGGLGHVGLQILKATTGCRIIALDTDESKLELARQHGADETVISDGEAAAKLLKMTNDNGVDVVFDFVGVSPTVTLATNVVAAGGAIRIIGLGGGSFPFEASLSGEPLPWGVNVQRSYGGTHQDQLEVIALARNGRIKVTTQTYPLEKYQDAIDDLRNGKVVGRAVIIP